ncbi:MAG: signal peptidase II [Ignavibacteria bacterium]|nr:signal peptidase II [Ignavibacteria bacterium]
MKVLYLSLVVIVFDQISKILVKGFKIPFLGINHRGIKMHQSVQIIGDFFQLTHVENYGIAFGLDFGKSFKLVVSIFTLVASILILLYLHANKDRPPKFRIGLALIWAGAVGNLIDRTLYGILYGYAPVFHGRVVDFIHIDFFDYSLFGKYFQSLPIFNLADLSVLLGSIVLIVFSWKHNSNSNNINAEDKLDEPTITKTEEQQKQVDE